MQFLNFNNEIINISNIRKISIRQNHISILLDDIEYEYTTDKTNIKELINKLHDSFNTGNNITLNFDLN